MCCNVSCYVCFNVFCKCFCYTGRCIQGICNELSWLNKTSSVEEYCVYDMNKDGIKELIVKTGTCEADYVYRFYSCEYGKIITLGTFQWW